MSAALQHVPDDIDMRDLAWSVGDLSYLMHSGQEAARDWFWNRPERILVMLCSRRFGKTILAAGLVHEVAMRVPRQKKRGAKIRIASGTAKDVKENLEPAMDIYRHKAPPWALAEYHEHLGRYQWPNGSRAFVAGVNKDQEDRLRGRECDLFVVEEGSDIDRLRYLIRAVARPQVLTTGGKILILLTPPESPAHESVEYITEAEAKGTLFKRTVYDAPHITPDELRQIIEDYGGEQSTDFRREFLCEIITDETRAIIPEFQREEPYIVVPFERPSHFVPRVAMDVGYHDLTFVVFGYHNFELGLDDVSHEVVLHHATSSDINEAVSAMEREAFGEVERVGRVVDAPPIVVADLRRHLGAPANDNAGTAPEDERALAALGWAPARKDDADAALNALRVRVRDRKIRIHPRCTHLIAHMRNGIWNKARTTFERSGAHGHFDGIDAAKYFVRHLNRTTNPFPLLRHGERRETHRIPRDLGNDRNTGLRDLARTLGGKRR